MRAITFLCVLALLLPLRAQAQNDLPAGGKAVIAANALLTSQVGGLERTDATAKVIAVTGQPFPKALQVKIGKEAAESNATQMTLPNAVTVNKGDTLLASLYVRGNAAEGKRAAQIALLFERRVDPWTKSIVQDISTAKNAAAWKRVLIPFAAAETYQPGEAMVSLRFAFGPQTVAVGGLAVLNYGKTKTVDELVRLSAEKNVLGAVTAAVHLNRTRQTLEGFGGNFCQPRYGATQPMDAVGRYNLEHLRVVRARIGIPLNWWTPEKGVYKDQAQAHAALLLMQEMTKRKIPIIGSIWEGPQWMLGGEREQMGRTLPPEKYEDCIEAIAQFLVTARDKYGVTVDYFSFNEADYGVNFKFTSDQIIAFIQQAGPYFHQLNLKTKFLTGDTANGGNFVAYARPLLEEKSIAPYLGPLALHCWDVLGIPDARYEEIAALGRKYKKPVWCTEAGHDSQLWQAPDPWKPWENGLRTALAYEKTLRLSGSSLMLYWTYQDNYPLVSQNGRQPYSVHHVIKQMEEALRPGMKIAEATPDNDNLRVLPAIHPLTRQFSVLLINPIGAGTVTLTGLTPGKKVTVVVSDARGQRKRLSSGKRIDRQGRLTIALPTRSVVTLIGD